MTLEDFEKQLAEEKRVEEDSRQQSKRDGSRDRSRQHKHHHHRHHRSHRSSREKEYRDNDEDRHRSKRRRRADDREYEESHRSHRKRSPIENTDQETEAGLSNEHELQRDSWMQAPSSLEIDYVQNKRQKLPETQSGSLAQDYELRIHKNELNHHLRDLQDSSTVQDPENEAVAQDVGYKFGDAGSDWRMTKLRAVYRQAKESERPVDAVALERYGSLKDFDDAREEEAELERRRAYGKDYVGKEKPSGELFQERKLRQPETRQFENSSLQVESQPEEIITGVAAPAQISSSYGQKVDQTTLNKMKAGLMRARLRKDPNLDQLTRQYEEAVVSVQKLDPTVVTLSAMDDRMLSAAPRNEVRTVSNRRGAERGNVEENEDMSIEDMVREERRSRHQAGGEGKRFAERIAKDGKFDNDLDYMDENATKLAKHVHKSDGNLRNIAINDYQKMNKILENCPLCHHEDTATPPIAPLISLATRVYLTLPTEPELASHAAMIVPIEHRVNLLDCDDDEWEEIRNFMKSLTRMYHDQGRDVIFYENAAHPKRKPHAALAAIPLPYGLGETAPAFFQEAFLTAEDEWSQHKKIIDTLAKSKQGLGKLAFRRTLVKEMPYFHVWFEIDGGIGHVVEEVERWPKGDLFAREIIGGMLGLEPDVIKRQGRWHRGHDPRMESFRKKWRKFDWTRVLSG